MTDLFTLGVGMDVDPLKKGTKELDRVGKSATSAEKNLKGVTTASKQTGGAFKSLQGQAANVGYQLQDIAVQAQMGTNAFVIMAQQGGQLLSPFSAVAGILATVAGVAGGLLYNNLSSAGDATKSYNDEIELLSQTVSVSERGLVSFSDQFGRLAAERPEVAISRLRGELERVSSIMNIVSSDTSLLLSDFGASTYTIQSANAQLEAFTGTQEELAEIIGQETLLGFTDSANAAMMGVSRLQEQVVSLSEGFEISQDDALQLTKVLANIDTPQGVIDASIAVSAMAMRLQGASPEIDRLNVKLNEQRVRAENLLYSQQTLNKALGDTQNVAGQTETALDATSKANLSAAQAVLSLNQQIEIQTTAMEDGEEAAIRLAAEMALGENVSETLRQKVGDLAVEYYGLKEAEKEAQAQQRALAQEQAQAAREQDQINSRAQKAVEQATLQSMTREEQIRAEAAATIALINASTELNDVQKELAGIQVQENAQKEIAEGAEKALKNVPSDFAMSVGEALASQDYSSFGNILASQAASFIGTAVTDAVGGSLGGIAGGLVGGAAGAVISQAISDYMVDDLIALERQASQGTGTVLGSIDAKSQSIANSLDYMSEGLDDLIGVNTDGFKAIQALSDSLTGASNLIARDFDASGIATGLGLSSLGSITQDFGGIVDDFFGGLTGGLFEGVFGGIGGALFGSSSVSDKGINLLGGTIAEMIDNDVTQAYQTVTKKSLFSKSRSTNYRFAGDAIEQQFDLTLEAMRDAVTTSAESLGMLPSEIQANLDAFTIEAQKISIKDLSAEEVADELEAVFSSIFDGLAAAVVPYVNEFQEAGEGAGETLSRLSTNLSVVDEMLAQLRLGELQGTTQEMLTLSEGVVDFFGDASSLASAFTGFVDEFATQERQLEILTGNLTEALGDQDVAILSSRDGVYDYIASLERLDGDNVERIANILSLTDSLDEYFDLLESVGTVYTDLQIRLAEAQSQNDLSLRLTREQELAEAVDDTARSYLNAIYAAEDANTALDDAFAVLEKSINNERDILRDNYDAQREAAQSVLDTLNDGIGDLTTVANSLKNAIDSTVDLSIAAAMAQLQGARSQIAAFAASGTIPDSDTLNSLLSTVTADSTKYYATAIDYYREQGRTANDIAELSGLADDQLSEAEQQIENQERILAQLQAQYEASDAALDAQLQAAQDQYDILTDSYVELTEIKAAIGEYSAAVVSAGGGGTGSSGVGIGANDIVSYTADGRPLTWNDIVNDVPRFANGGTHTGGLAMVGEIGPEIVNMPAGSHVSTASQTRSLMDTSNLENLIQELITKTSVQNSYVKGSRDILQRVSNGGNAFATDAIIIKDVTV